MVDLRRSLWLYMPHGHSLAVPDQPRALATSSVDWNETKRHRFARGEPVNRVGPVVHLIRARSASDAKKGGNRGGKCHNAPALTEQPTIGKEEGYKIVEDLRLQIPAPTANSEQEYQ